jgi:hypothetical protein
LEKSKVFLLFGGQSILLAETIGIGQVAYKLVMNINTLVSLSIDIHTCERYGQLPYAGTYIIISLRATCVSYCGTIHKQGL